MLIRISALAAALTLASPMALAKGNQGLTGDEAKTAACRVLDASGAELPAKVASSTSGTTLQITGEGDLFSYSIEMTGAVALLSLADKRSGDKVKVKEGMLDVNETVAVTLTSDENPGASLTLECLGQ